MTTGLWACSWDSPGQMRVGCHASLSPRGSHCASRTGTVHPKVAEEREGDQNLALVLPSAPQNPPTFSFSSLQPRTDLASRCGGQCALWGHKGRGLKAGPHPHQRWRVPPAAGQGAGLRQAEAGPLGQGPSQMWPWDPTEVPADLPGKQDGGAQLSLRHDACTFSDLPQKPDPLF